MRLVHFFDPETGNRVGRVEGDSVIDCGAAEATGALGALLSGSTAEGNGRTYAYAELFRAPSEGEAHLLAPVVPPEVWGCGVTYKRSAEFRDSETGVEEGIYDKVYRAERPELFFKATAVHCVGPNAAIRIRSDSSFTAPEPELALVLDRNGKIIGYTLADDVSAWDIERDNPLYLPQSKIFLGCCSLGPVVASVDEVSAPYEVELTCTITRGSETIYSGSASTAQLNRRFEELIGFLMRDNSIPDGTILLTGTGIIVPSDVPLQKGDIVSISAPGFGTLSNPAQ
jgi:2-dehydro-3-deoxy-D-arabinonate dehydratase